MRSVFFCSSVLPALALAAAAGAGENDSWDLWSRWGKPFRDTVGNWHLIQPVPPPSSPPPAPPSAPAPEGICMGEEMRVLLDCADDAARLGCPQYSSREEIECLDMNLDHVSVHCRVRARAPFFVAQYARVARDELCALTMPAPAARCSPRPRSR